MKKNKKWFIDKWTKERDKTDVHDPMYHFINEFITDMKELDEPEVLSQKWTEKHTWNNHYIGKPFVYVEDLQNLLVPKQELPAIPKYVADYLYSVRGDVSLIKVMELVGMRHRFPKWKKEYDWISENQETFARAWLDGYKVEEESLYYALLKGHELIIDRGCMTPKYWKLDTSNGRVFPSHRLTNLDTYLNEMTKEDWNGIGVNDSNADFVKVDEKKRGDNNG